MKYNYDNYLYNICRCYKKSILTEGIEEIKKYYPLFKPYMFETLAALDPTYKGGNELGTYTKWIYNLYNNYLKDKIALQKWQEQKQQGKDYPKPEKKFKEQIEDFNKIHDLLKKFDAIKKKANLNINNIKSIADLYLVVTNTLKSEDISEKSEVQHALDLVKESVSKGAQIIYRTNKWIILIPKTFESSKVFGEDTNWCTTASSGYYYNMYMDKYGGEYLINVDLSTGDLYQFHFESGQFMNAADKRIDMDDFTTDYPEVANFLKEYKENEYNKKPTIDDMVEEKMNDTEWLKNYFNIDNFKYENGDIVGNMDLSDIVTTNWDNDYIVYNENGSNAIQVESLDNYLSGEGFDNPYFYDYSLNEITQYTNIDNTFNSNFKNISWDDVKMAYKYGTTGGIDADYDNLSFEQLDQLFNLLDDDFYEGNGIHTVYGDCVKYGTQTEAENDILNQLNYELPIDKTNNYFYEDGKLDIKITNNQIKKTIKFLLENKNHYNTNNENKEWYEKYENNDESDYYDDAPWLFIWRCANISEDGFTITEPYYGWNGFDDKMWDEAVDTFIKNVKKIFSED